MQNEEFRIQKFLLASKQKRVLNWIIDSLIKLIILRLVVSSLNSSVISNKINSFDMIERYLFWSIISFVYYGVTEVFLSRSLAKFLTKTIVVMENGSKPSTITILTRTILRILPFEALTFLRGRALGLHDENSGTFVVIKSKLEQQKNEHLALLSLEKS
ncbi:RDD family protein [Flavobacterium aquicola]|uniref:Putative RDD family membrane protein YckC n=1 Tax=Flavobacterium aquicola TaxID=1682742 RepID=A0A3E0EPI1_9FLAO|nr:RDD family protein [Flavobacterium aquicola]REH00079.1 putative RDD family membrane protein YckC [Flavobacterium aquicola]